MLYFSNLFDKVLYMEFKLAKFLQLTFKSLAVSLRTTRFNIQNFYMVLALH
jgi:hypothetical protein